MQGTDSSSGGDRPEEPSHSEDRVMQGAGDGLVLDADALHVLIRKCLTEEDGEDREKLLRFVDLMPLGQKRDLLASLWNTWPAEDRVGSDEPSLFDRFAAMIDIPRSAIEAITTPGRVED